MSDDSKTELGPPCKRGHDRDGTGRSMRYKSTRQCVDCMNERRATYGKMHYEANAEAIRERARKNHHSRRDARLARMKTYHESDSYRESREKYYEANRDEILERRRVWREENKLAVYRSNHKHYAENREAEKARMKAYRQTERGRLVLRILNARRRARKKGARIEAYGASELEARFAIFGWKCAYCGGTESLTIDHVHPLAKGGVDSPTNIVPACRSCNYSKGKKEARSWFESQGFWSEERWIIIASA
jgi:5-methylcytosine-specific restriction endonuclease McrA